MKMLMPSHAKRVQPYRDPQIGLFHRFQVESQIDAIHSPIVQLRSGGYVVINQTEALVAIDVNSGRSTRERNIEETALRTNLEAAEEIARQLRLRDLAGLIVIDFIDMEEHRNQGAVERRLKEALKNDRARIQVGRISPFGLLEMSRQRLRPSLVEASTQPCPHCGGTGFIRSTESTALYVLRSIEEEGMRRRSAEICVYVPTTVALYILNQKRDSLAQVEARYGIHVLVARDDALIPPAFRLERLRAYGPGEATAPLPAPLTQAPAIDEDEEDEEVEEEAEGIAAERPEPAAEEDREDRGRGRRRRRRRRRHEETPAARAAEPVERAGEEGAPVAAGSEDPDGGDEANAEQHRRRRGRRGGRRKDRREAGAETGFETAHPAAEIEILPTAEVEEKETATAATAAGWPPEASVEMPVAAAATAAVPTMSGNGEMADAAGQGGPFATGNGAEPTRADPTEEAKGAGLVNPPTMPSTAEAEIAAPVFAETVPAWQMTPPSQEPGSIGPAYPEPAVEVRDVAPAMPPAAEAEPAPPVIPESVPPWQMAPPLLEPDDNGPAHLGTAVEIRDAAPAVPPPAAEAEPAAPLPVETAPPSASEATAAEPPPAHPVQTVSQKPADPRKGWWQRLMQS